MLLRTLLLLTLGGACAAAEPMLREADCYTGGWSRSRLLQLPTQGFEVTDAQRSQLLQQLRFCLAAPEPDIRDAVAYQAYFTWLRSGLVPEPEVRQLLEVLLADIRQQRADAHQVYLPFAVLVLAEVVRVDRKQPYLSTAERQVVLDTVDGYLQQLRDYRGFEEGVGWRHGVAHSADVLLQLALNSALTAEQAMQMATVLARQVHPEGTHFYIYGEPARLARATAYLMLNPAREPQFWESWVHSLASPAPLEEWAAVFGSEQGLAKRHNTRAFLLELHALLGDTQSPRLAPVLAALHTAISQVP